MLVDLLSEFVEPNLEEPLERGRTATPPGVREPNHLGIVEFEVPELHSDGSSDSSDGLDGELVPALGQLTTADGVSIDDEVEPVYVEELRGLGAGIREPASQAWDGFRFKSV